MKANGWTHRARLRAVGLALLAAGCSGSGASATFTVSLTVRLDGGGTAIVASDPPGLTCTQGTCSASFPRGAPVTLQATPGSARFVRWSGACLGSASVCQLAGDASVDAVFLGANYVFTTSSSHAPAALTLAAADAVCAARAAEAGLPGTYVAWLSTATTDAATRLPSGRGWVRTDGLPFAASVDALVAAGAVLYPARLDERGRAVERTEVLTGTDATGHLMAGYNCSDWSSSSGVFVFGDAGAGPGGWTEMGGTICGAPANFHLYCFGTDAAAPVAITPVLGRLAFLSRPIASGGGVAGFDAACAADAAAAGRSGKFKALVATGGAAAASRFDLTGPAWVRADGIPVVASASSLMTQALLAPIAVRADGSYALEAPRAWTGAVSPFALGPPETTCSDWTIGTAAGAGGWGLSTQTEGPPASYKGAAGFFHMETTSCGGAGVTACAATQPCDRPGTLYCLQE